MDGAFHILKLAALGYVVARWKLDLLLHRLLCVAHIAADVDVDVGGQQRFSVGISNPAAIQKQAEAAQAHVQARLTTP